MSSWGGQWQPDMPNSPENAASRAGDPRATINDLRSVTGTDHLAGFLDLDYTPQRFADQVLARYDLLQSGDAQAAAVAVDPHADAIGYLAKVDADLNFHMTASWADVRRKAKRIKEEGGVRIVAASHDGIVGEVQGEHHLYESEFTFVPGRKAIAAWNCGCKWGAYAWGRSPAYARFEGRQCSHVTALQYEAQSRGMFGKTVRPDDERLEGQHPHSPVTVEYQRPTDRNEGGNRNRRTVPPGNMRTEWTPGSRVRIKGNLEEYGIPTVQGSNFGTDDLAPVHVFALQMVAADDEPDAVLQMLARYGVPSSIGLRIITWAADKNKNGIDDAEEATADPMGGQSAPGTDIPRLEDRDQTDAKHKKKHILHHTNDAREHAPNFGWGIGHGIGPLIWCDQCNGSGCGHCGGTGQVVAPGGSPTDNMGPGDMSTTTAPIADQSPDAGQAISGDGLSATSGLQLHEALLRYYADTNADSMQTSPGQTYQQETPHSNSPNPGSTGWATSADPSDWEQPIIGTDFGISDHYGSLPSDASGATTPVIGTTAGEALPRAVGFDLGVLDGVFVPEGTMSLGSVQGAQAAPGEDVRAASARREVIEAYARAVQAGLPTWTVDSSVMALVVDDVARRYQASQQHEDQSVRLPDLPLPVHMAIAAAALGAHPDMARVAGTEGDAGEKPKWDPPTVSGVALKAHDTGRILMIQRSNKNEDDPAKGTWEMPGGHHEEGDQTSLHAGIREWQEETGHPFPEGGHVSHTWRSGPYQGHVVVIPKEEAVDFSNGRATTNPDDPDGDDHEQSAWWEIEHAKKNPALRPELKDASPWSGISKAAAYMTGDEVRGAAREEEQRTGKTSEQLLREQAARQDAYFATLHEEPEPALPSTDGADETPDSAQLTDAPGQFRDAQPETPWGYAQGDPDLMQSQPPEPQMSPTDYEGDAAHDSLTDDVTNNMPFRSEASFDDVPIEHLVGTFQATAGGQALKPGKGESSKDGPTDADIAANMRRVLTGDVSAIDKTAMKEFSFSEQQELIGEGGNRTRARNFNDLKIDGTHYARLGEDMVDDDEYLLL